MADYRCENTLPCGVWGEKKKKKNEACHAYANKEKLSTTKTSMWPFVGEQV